MASFEELKNALRETLEANGAMRQLRAQIRAEIFKALDDQPDSKPPALASEQFFVNELVREYLNFHKYSHTLSVFLPESGQPDTSIDRSFLIRECGLNEAAVNPTLPVLYSLVGAYRRLAATPLSLAPASTPDHVGVSSMATLQTTPAVAPTTGGVVAPFAGLPSSASAMPPPPASQPLQLVFTNPTLPSRPQSQPQPPAEQQQQQQQQR